MLCRAELQRTVGQLQATQSSSTAASAAVTDAAGRRVQQLEARARQQEQHIQELHADSHELHAQADAARREAAIAHKQLRESRAAFKARTEHFALEVGRVCSPFTESKSHKGPAQNRQPFLNPNHDVNLHGYTLKVTPQGLNLVCCAWQPCVALHRHKIPGQMQSLQYWLRCCRWAICTGLCSWQLPTLAAIWPPVTLILQTG